MAFNIESVPNQAGKPAILLREAWREGKRIRKRTVANLSKFPPEVVEGFRAVLKGAVAVRDVGDLLQVERSLLHGHVAAVLGTARDLGLERILHRTRGRERDLALAAVVARVLSPDSKLATARRLSPETATSSLGALLGLGPVAGNEVLDMLDWLLKRQPWIERSLANRHLEDGTLILYDVSSSYLEGSKCTLAAFGHNRDGKKGKRQIVFGMLCAAGGCPVAVEVFPGNASDPSTVARQVNRIRRCRNGAANQAGAGRVRKVVGLVSLSLPHTTCAIVSGGGVPEGTLLDHIATERTTTMEIFIGLDVSLASTSVCAIGANGKTVNEAKVPSDPGSLAGHMRGLSGNIIAVGLEAGPQSQWLHKGLSEAGFETVLMETKRVKSALKSAPVKTDRRDAEGIAQLLRMGWFQPVHCKSVASQEKRALLTSRSALVEGLTRLELSVRGILRNFGLKLGRVSKGRWEERVRDLTADNAMLSDAVGPILRLRRQMRSELAMMTKKVRILARSDATCRLLMTMPGVGPVTALTFVTAVDDPSRFRRARDIGAWAGLTPKRSQSGERDVSGEITRAGDVALRTALFQAATSMLHHGKRMSWLKAWALRVAGRRGQKRATTALARRMGVVLLRMWLDGTEFRFAREAAMSPDPA